MSSDSSITPFPFPPPSAPRSVSCSKRSLHKRWLVAGDISMPGFTWLHFVRNNCGIQTGVGWVRGRQRNRGMQWEKVVLKAFANLQLPGLLKPFSNFAAFDIFANFPCLCCCSSITDKKSLSNLALFWNNEIGKDFFRLFNILKKKKKHLATAQQFNKYYSCRSKKKRRLLN